MVFALKYPVNILKLSLEGILFKYYNIIFVSVYYCYSTVFAWVIFVSLQYPFIHFLPYYMPVYNLLIVNDANNVLVRSGKIKVKSLFLFSNE